jgi:hypothetical protein
MLCHRYLDHPQGLPGRIRASMDACKHSMLAYSEPSRIHKLARSVDRKLDVITTYDGVDRSGRDAQAYMMLKGREVVVAFRGTLNAMDMIDAMDVRQTDMHILIPYAQRRSKVHRGFYDQFTSIEPDITQDLKKIVGLGGVDCIRFTGHSMGAAIAALAAGHYSEGRGGIDGNIGIACDAFGSPQFADRAFAARFDRVDHISVHMEHDIVPMIPIQPNFAYMPSTVELTSDGVASCIMDLQNRRSFMAFTKVAMRYGSLKAITANHAIDAYWTGLRMFLKRFGTAVAPEPRTRPELFSDN